MGQGGGPYDRGASRGAVISTFRRIDAQACLVEISSLSETWAGRSRCSLNNQSPIPRSRSKPHFSSMGELCRESVEKIKYLFSFFVPLSLCVCKINAKAFPHPCKSTTYVVSPAWRMLVMGGNIQGCVMAAILEPLTLFRWVKRVSGLLASYDFHVLSLHVSSCFDLK